MQKPQGYDEAQVYGDYETLPLGGHVCKIKQAKIEPYDWGNVLVIAFDIAEGSNSGGFYQRQFDSQTENKKWKGTYRVTIPVNNPSSEKEIKTLRIFKTAMTSIEESNIGFKWNWDENALKGKMFGGVFGRKQYDFNNKQGFYTECRFLRSVETIKKGVEIPEDKLLADGVDALASKAKSMGVDFTEITGVDSDLPF